MSPSLQPWLFLVPLFVVKLSRMNHFLAVRVQNWRRKMACVCCAHAHVAVLAEPWRLVNESGPAPCEWLGWACSHMHYLTYFLCVVRAVCSPCSSDNFQEHSILFSDVSPMTHNRSLKLAPPNLNGVSFHHRVPSPPCPWPPGLGNCHFTFCIFALRISSLEFNMGVGAFGICLCGTRHLA